MSPFPSPYSGYLIGRIHLAGSAAVKGATAAFACRAQFWTLRRVHVVCGIRPASGDEATLNLSEIGTLHTRYASPTEEGFSALVIGSEEHFATLDQKLAALELRRQSLNPFRDFRTYQRFVPADKRAAITLSDGSRYPCTIKDASQSGAAVEADHIPPNGTILAIGTVIGKVVRLFPGGFAILFSEVQEEEKVASRLARGWHLVL